MITHNLLYYLLWQKVPQIIQSDIAADTNICKMFVSRVLEDKKYHLQLTNDDDSDRRMQYPEVMQDLCTRNHVAFNLQPKKQPSFEME